MKKLLSLLLLLALLFSVWGYSPVSAQTSIYLIPKPDSKYNLPGTTLAIRYGVLIDRNSLVSKLFNVTGSASGDHLGKIVLANDMMTILFKPNQSFVPGETVTARLLAGVRTTSGEILPNVSYSFMISKTSASLSSQLIATLENPHQDAPSVGTITDSDKLLRTSSYVTVPSDFPSITVTVPATNTAEGYIFASNFLPEFSTGAPNIGSYLLILDNQGEPVYYKKIPETTIATDFKKLTNGLLAYGTYDAYHLLDNHYNEVGDIRPGNGYTETIDIHELQLLPGGNYIYMIYDGQYIDMSTVVPGGNPHALVIGTVIQEQDPDRNVVWEWSSWDHIPIIDTNQSVTAPRIDYVHGNAVELDTDGNILLSSRHLDEITKINHDNGEILWRLGGKANQFTFFGLPGITDAPHFYLQHDIRRIGGNVISLFDNHNLHDAQNSRAAEYFLDEPSKIATLIWQYRHTPDLFTPFMGNAQYLPNGNFGIGWGGNPSVSYTEVNPFQGTTAFEIDIGGPYISYRVFRFPWQGYPDWPPDLVLQPGNGAVNLFFSWNGATEVSKYQVFGGNFFQPSTLLGEVSKSGFEASLELNGAQANYCYYRVLPIDKQDQPTQYSNTVVNPPCHFAYLPSIEVSGN